MATPAFPPLVQSEMAFSLPWPVHNGHWVDYDRAFEYRTVDHRLGRIGCRNPLYLVNLDHPRISVCLVCPDFGTREGLLPVNTKFEEAKERFSLERIAKASSVLAMLGLVAIAGAFSRWGSEGFGAQDMRSLLQLLIPAMTSVVLAAQSLLSRMVLSVMEIPSKSVVG